MNTNYKNNCLYIGKALKCSKTNKPCQFYEKACPYNESKEIDWDNSIEESLEL